ncbi:sugar ABC transporter permease [Sinomonas sp. ASV486]|uniref:carbohydrate ABC transporter permease n=1 Tax=Sinomonas sp. ASV486 TaxID=3051170 RepID=UPI0027DCB3CF|nr:sugar ABC transporter permease [Sinomonas sp. ASV486]MDQ4490830.1 sugar ABC transporter permease [Sinomonas sp. ASV486]
MSFLWAVPGVAIAVGVHLVAVGAGAVYAFTDWNGTSAGANWIGIDNFREIFSSPDARDALITTIELSVAAVILSNVIGIALALGLHRTLRSRNVLRAVFFAPFVLSPLAVSYIWQFIFDAQGPLNKVLGDVGLGTVAQPWLASPTWARWTILVVLIWQYSGLAMAFYLAGLQSIPEEVEEAAAVDGASTVRRLRTITLPLLAPAITASVSITTVFSLRVFDQVLALTGGGPGSASETLATQVYKQTFVSGRFGYGAALALVLTALVAIVSVLQIVILRAGERKI